MSCQERPDAGLWLRPIKILLPIDRRVDTLNHGGRGVAGACCVQVHACTLPKRQAHARAREGSRVTLRLAPLFADKRPAQQPRPDRKVFARVSKISTRLTVCLLSQSLTRKRHKQHVERERRYLQLIEEHRRERTRLTNASLVGPWRQQHPLLGQARPAGVKMQRQRTCSSADPSASDFHLSGSHGWGCTLTRQHSGGKHGIVKPQTRKRRTRR